MVILSTQPSMSDRFSGSRRYCRSAYWGTSATHLMTLACLKLSVDAFIMRRVVCAHCLRFSSAQLLLFVFFSAKDARVLLLNELSSTLNSNVSTRLLLNRTFFFFAGSRSFKRFGKH